jgi:hypothetical protein
MNYVMQCTQNDAVAVWNHSIQELESWMPNNGHTELVELIILAYKYSIMMQEFHL